MLYIISTFHFQNTKYAHKVQRKSRDIYALSKIYKFTYDCTYRNEVPYRVAFPESSI